MFARLKEKIQKEGGNVTSDVDRSKTVVPVHGSPKRLSLAGSPAQSPLKKEADGFYTSREDLTKDDISSSEDPLAALQKRTEQCKQLQDRLTEYSDAIRDSSKKIEKLEAFIEKQQNASAKKLQELAEQHRASLENLTAKHKLELEKANNEKETLLQKIKDAESIRDKLFKTEEEKEEFQQFTTQEIGKLKHMLILKEEELTKSQKELQEKAALLTQGQERVKQLSELETRIKDISQEKSMLEEESASHGRIVSSLTRERMEMEEKVISLNTAIAEKTATLSNLQSRYTDLESAHQALQRNSDLQKNKLNQQLQEQTDQVDQLSERVKLLQQRGQDQSLSGDERTQALEKERDTLERKLTETREQLSQIKSSWSEKISHLEHQISHLNKKIAEDSDELKEARNYVEMVKNTMQKEIDSEKDKVKEAEKQSEAKMEYLKNKEAEFKKERLDLETVISSVRLEKVDLDTQLRAKLASVESQLMSLELERAQETNQLQEEVTKVRKDLSQTESALVKSAQEIQELITEKAEIQSRLSALESDHAALRALLSSKEKHGAELSSHRQLLVEELKITQEKLERAHEREKSKSAELLECNKEKDEFMMRNAQLSQQLTSLQQSSQDDRRGLEAEKAALEGELATKAETESRLSDRCRQLQSQVEELSTIHTDHVTNSEQLRELEQTVVSLEDQLAEKNKALKKQEQRLNDLKKTLQRELKVQSLPNDEPIDAKIVAVTPPMPRKNSIGRENPKRSHRHLSYDQSPIPGDPVNDSTQGHSNSYAQHDFFVGQNTLFNQRTGYGHGANSDYHATISVNDSQSASSRGAYSVQSSGRQSDRREFDMQHLEKDVNFQYLKHVVMKFMLSREHEAIHLIKAVSLLLRFTPDEQKLIRDTLEWKMSWFGGSQPPAVLKGQTNKIIPPSY